MARDTGWLTTFSSTLRRSAWHDVFDPARLQVRHFADGGVRITIGTRDSTRAVLAAVEKAMV